MFCWITLVSPTLSLPKGSFTQERKQKTENKPLYVFYKLTEKRGIYRLKKSRNCHAPPCFSGADELHYVDPYAQVLDEDITGDLYTPMISEGENSTMAVILGPFWSGLVQGLQQVEVLHTWPNTLSRTALRTFADDELIFQGLGFPIMVNMPRFR